MSEASGDTSAFDALAERWKDRVAALLGGRDGRVAGSLRRIIAVARKELRQLRRDPLTLAFVVGVPAAQLWLFGYAIEQDVRQVETAVVDHASTSLSRRLLGELEATQTFRIVRQAPNEEAAHRLIEKGEVAAAIIVPEDYTTNYYRGRGAEILILVDASDPTRARAAEAAASGLMEHHNRRLQSFVVDPGSASQRAPQQRTTFGAEPELVRQQFLRFAVLQLYNPELRTPVFVVPALLGVILTTTMILMTSLALVRERERGCFEFLIATPVRRTELMFGKLLPYVAIGFVQIVLVVSMGLAIFQVPIRGSLLDLSAASALFIAANLTLGLVISSVAASQFQATQMSFFFFLPSVLLSGFMFPFTAMPRPAQWLGELLPLTHYVRCTRGILLRGSQLVDHLPELAAMGAFTALGFFAATQLFTKRLG